jgi:hypothetical protein
MCTFSHRVSTDSKINETVGKLTGSEVFAEVFSAVREEKYSSFYMVNAGFDRFKREGEVIKQLRKKYCITEQINQDYKQIIPYLLYNNEI